LQIHVHVLRSDKNTGWRNTKPLGMIDDDYDDDDDDDDDEEELRTMRDWA
jgi:hypothetical protein